VPAGTRVKVVGMYERDRSLLEYFDGLGLRPGSQFQVVSRNYDDTMTLDFGVKQVHLGQAAAKKVWVQGDTGCGKTRRRCHSEEPQATKNLVCS